MNVSIILPLYKPNQKFLAQIIKRLESQKFNGLFEILKVDLNKGLAKQINIGIEWAKFPIIVTLHQDCLPKSNTWLQDLVGPLMFKEVVASCSDIYDAESKKVYTPLLDGKSCAYKKFALHQVGYFDEKTFLNSGEDMDMYLKLKKIGAIAYRNSIVEHHHPGYLKAKGYKKYQNANTWGCLFNRYGTNLPGWWKPFFKFYDFLYIYYYCRGFWKGKQDFTFQARKTS